MSNNPNKIYVVGDDGICTILNKELFRYHSIDDDLINSLKGNYLWFSDPANFNDPYDCNLDFDFENTLEELEIFFNEVNNRPDVAHMKMSDSELKKQIDDILKNSEILAERDRNQRIEEVKKNRSLLFFRK